MHTLGIRLDVPTAAHGWAAADEARARAGLDGLAAGLPVHRDARTLVLGDEEFLYLPQLLAAALGPQVRTSSTTRSPAVALDVPGYPLRTALRFAATDDPQRAAFAYNVAPSARPDPGNAPGFDDVVLVTDVHGAARRPHVRAGLLAQLAAVARRSVHVVTISTGSADSPEQGSGC